MNANYIFILTLGLIIISTLLFTIIYYLLDDKIYFDDALYYSVQIQTSIGAIDISRDKTIKNVVTVQSIISYALGITLVTMIGIITSCIFIPGFTKVVSN
jgi:hypothetical protein